MPCLIVELFPNDSGAVVVMIVSYLDLQLPVESAPITAKVVSLNPVHCKVYLIQHYVIKFVSDLRQVSGFFWVLRFPPRYSWNIVESGVKHHSPTKRQQSIIYFIRLPSVGHDWFVQNISDSLIYQTETWQPRWNIV